MFKNGTLRLVGYFARVRLVGLNLRYFAAKLCFALLASVMFCEIQVDNYFSTCSARVNGLILLTGNIPKYFW
jgi:hypothetical protein